MEFWTENIILILLIGIALFLTILDMAGNWWLLVVAAGYGVLDNFQRFPMSFLCWIFLVFVLGELWEIIVGFFGVKRKEVSWFTVFLIGIGTLFGTLVGTIFLPIFGSLVGGAMGGGIVAYLYEYRITKNKENAARLAWLAFKTQLLAALGKVVAGIVMAAMLLSRLLGG